MNKRPQATVAGGVEATTTTETLAAKVIIKNYYLFILIIMVKNVKNCFYQLTKAYETVIEEMKLYVRMLCVFKRIRSLSVSK